MTAPAGRYEVVERVPELVRRDALANRTVLVVGCGAIGSAVAEHLVRSGVGSVRVVDRDVVEERNLPVQVLYSEQDVALGALKAEAAASRLQGVNADCVVEGVVADFAPSNALRLSAGADLLVDGADNLETKFLLNDVAVATGTPLAYAGCAGTEGAVMAVVPGATPCLRCLWPDPTPAAARMTCETRGLLPAAAAMVAALQFTEALKILLGEDRSSLGGLVRIDAWEPGLRRIPLPPFPGPEPCRACGIRDFAYLRGDHSTRARELCGDDTVLLYSPAPTDLDGLRHRHSGNGTLRSRPDCVQLEVDGCRIVAFASGRTLIHGAGGVDRARVLYGRHVVG